MKPINKIILICLCALFCLSPFSINPSRAAGCDTTSDMMLVSVKTGGEPINQLGNGHDLSDDGRFIVFHSQDATIVENDTNDAVDTFLHDRETCTTYLVSRNPSGVPGTSDGYFNFPPHINADGRYVLFDSEHTDLVASDTNGMQDVFLYDHQTQTVTRISVGLGGKESNGGSYASDISPDGRFILFNSFAKNLVENDTNNVADTFLFDRNTNVIERVSVNSDEEQGNAQSWLGEVSPDGRFVAFISHASNFSSLDTTTHQKAFLRDRQEGTTTLVSVNSDGESADGETVVAFLSDDMTTLGMITEADNFADEDTNGNYDGYVRNLLSGETTWVTPRTTTDWAYAWAASANGRYIATETSQVYGAGDANNIADVYLFDTLLGITTRQSRTPTGEASNGYAISPMLNADANYVLFRSDASNLIADPPSVGDVHLYLARVTLPSGSLNVEVGLQGRPTAPHPAWVTSFRVVIVPQGSTTPVYDELLMTDDNGSLAIPELNYGIYTVWVKGANTLAVSQSITLAADSLPVSVELLPAGDANGDNVVSLADFSILASSFGTQLGEIGYDARADFNGDNLVTLPDFSLLASNFSTIGDALPG